VTVLLKGDYMKQRTLVSLIVLLILLTGCTNQSPEQNENLDEVKRLADENIKLRQEQAELKTKVEELEVDKINAEENLRFARMTQEELLKEMSEDNLEMIQKTENLSWESVFGLSRFEFQGSSNIEFGNIINERIEDDGIDTVFNELSLERVEIIDNVTKSLCAYIKKEALEAQFQATMSDFETSDSNNREYIVLRIKTLLLE